MKKTCSIVFCIIMLCSLMLLGIASAGNAAYPLTEYQCVALATIDGKWTTADEWNDGPPITMSNNAKFTYNMDFTSYTIEWLVEIFTDNTTDAGDYWQICLDPDNSGGTTPQNGDLKIEIQGHTTFKLYQGTGTGWTLMATPPVAEDSWANTLAASTWNGTSHWILEFSDAAKTAGTIQTPQPPNGMRVAAYDANSSTLSAWPPGSSADVPDQYGVIADFSQDPIPEGLSLGIFVLLSSVAVIVGSYYIRKRPRNAVLIPARP